MRLHPTTWDDISNFIVHFTKGGKGANDYNSMMSIYGSGVLRSLRRFGIGKEMAPHNSHQTAVCFSEIPPGHWDRLVTRRDTKYGLAFTKEFVLSRGGGPIWYAWKDTPHWQTLQQMMTAAIGDADAPIWRITPMIDAPGTYGTSEYEFDWEREWRHIGDFSFKPQDVAFLLIPEHLHVAARDFFETVLFDNLGPAYLCPYVDPTWSKDRILETLGAAARK